MTKKTVISSDDSAPTRIHKSAHQETDNDADERTNQYGRFLETARGLACDEDKEGFEATLGTIASYKPQKGSDVGAPKTKAKRRKADR